MALDVLFRSTENQRLDNNSTPDLYSLAQSDVAESQLYPANAFLDSIYGDVQSERAGYNSRAQTPCVVGKVSDSSSKTNMFNKLDRTCDEQSTLCPDWLEEIDTTARPSPSKESSVVAATAPTSSSNSASFPSCTPSVVCVPISTTARLPFTFLTSPIRPVQNVFARLTRSMAKSQSSFQKDASSFLIATPSKPARNMPRPSALPQVPHVGATVAADPSAEYAIVVSMYEVYNDRIYDLLTASMSTSKVGVTKRRALLFKSTEQCPDRKVVAGLRGSGCVGNWSHRTQGCGYGQQCCQL
jgi:hypothetical protein